MILAILFAQVWGVVQLIVLTSLARTVRVRTIFAAMAVGFYAIAPVTAFLQLSWIRLAALMLGKSIADVTGIASYTVDPFIEEAIKLLPLATLMLIPAIRRQWSVTDCVIIAAATGSGFGLAEHLFRYANDPHNAQAVAGGWVLTIGSTNVLVPGIFRTLTSWLPNGAFFYSDVIIINWHLAWSAIGGLAVGLIARRRDRTAFLAAAGLFLLIGLTHAAGNTTDIHETWLAFLAAPLGFLTKCLALLAFASVVVAWWLDQPSQRAGRALGPLLAAEEAATSPIVGTFTASLSRLPWSIPWVYGFDRARRAYQSARVASPDSRDDLRDAVVAQRDSVDGKLKQREAPPLLPPWLTSGNLRSELRSALKRPPVIIWIVLIAPSVLYLIVGGFPQTAWLQRVLTGPGVWQLVLLITVLNLARVAWRVIIGFRRLPATAQLPIGDDAAMLGMQLACGVGAVSLGGFTVLRVLSGVSAGQFLLSHAHAADAANRVTPGSGSAVAGSAGAFDPPPPSPDLPEGPADAAAAAAAGGAGAGAGDGPESAARDAGEKAGDKVADDIASSKPKPPARPPELTPQEQADRAAAAAKQADADAAAARQARVDAMRAADAADIKQATADPGDDPDVAAARERSRSAQNAAEKADAAGLDGDDPWDPNAPNKSAADASQREIRDAKAAQAQAENEFAEKHAGDADPAKAAAQQAQDAQNAADAQAAAAHDNAVNAQAKADAAAAKAASDAARAANPAQAAADDAAKALADAQQKENDAFFGGDPKAYHDARAALDAARQKAEAAKAAADAARDGSSSPDHSKVKKP